MSNDFEKRYDIRLIGRLGAMMLVSCLMALFIIQSGRFTGNVFSEECYIGQMIRSSVIIICVTLIAQMLERLICKFSYYYYLENSPIFFCLEYILDGLTIVAGTWLLNLSLEKFFDIGISIRISYMSFLLIIGILYGMTTLLGLMELMRRWSTEREEKRLDRIMEEALGGDHEQF